MIPHADGELDSIHSRHHDIGEQIIWSEPEGDLQGSLTTIGRLGAKTRLIQDRRCGVGNHLLIVYD